jgi:signal transduction histidine kinase
MTGMRNEGRKPKNILVLILAAAIFAPGAALSLLALRAAEREAVYVERRLEEALAAEVGLAARRVEELVRDARDSLARDVQSGAGARVGWAKTNPVAGTAFTLRDGVLSVYASDRGAERNFRENFGKFLDGSARMSTYDLVTRIYKTEREPRQMIESKMETDASAREEVFKQASDEGFEIMNRNVIPMSKGTSGAGTPQTPPAASARAGGNARKLFIPGLVPEFEDASSVRSQTVSKSKSFAELSGESDYGLLPYMSEYGLEVLFWARSPEGGFSGCALRMDVFRDMAADALPNILSEARILTVLDENGTPIVAPDAAAAPDWRRPFAACEISPSLPRWEAGAWLTDPGIFAARADYARMTVWLQVAALIAVMLTGSFAAIRMVSYEMKVASQKTTFVANVSHELKTPLTSIRLYAELLLSGRQSDEERRREYLRTMMSEIDRLWRLIDNVLSFSGRGRGKFKTEPVLLSGIAEETVAQLEPQLEKQGFAVSFAASGDLPVLGDMEALKQVVLNLISNAEKYSGDGREIKVECGARGGFVRVDVSDRGIGVPPEMSERIFQEFFRGDDSLSSPHSGTGLGLSIARGIARRHGGDVIYSPREGGGSVFSLLLPEWRNGG